MIKPGSIVLPSKYLTEIVRRLPEEDVEIEVKEQLLPLFAPDRLNLILNGLDAEEYPRLPEIEENQMFSVPSDLLKHVIRQTVFAVSTQESRPILTGALWQLKDGQLTVVATDSHRLAQRKVKVEGDSRFRV